MATFLLCPHMTLPLCTHIPSVSVYVLICSYKDMSQIGIGPTLMASFYISHLFKDPLFRYSHILCYWG